MSGLSSFLGNRYTSLVATYLKTHTIQYGGGKEINLEKFDFGVPNEIPAEMSSLNVPLSLDLVASLSDSEFFAECKYDDEPKPLTISSRKFHDGILEFIGLEQYRELTFRKTIEYLFITNNPVHTLRRELETLRYSNSQDFSAFIESLERSGKEKWVRLTTRISEQLARSALGRTMILQIDKGALDEARSQKEFVEIAREFEDRIERKRAGLPFASYPIDSNIIVVGDKTPGERLTEIHVPGYTIMMPNTALDRIRLHLQGRMATSDVTKLGTRSLGLGNLSVDAPPNIAHTQISRMVTEAMNDILRSDTYLIVVAISERLILVFSRNWLGKLVSNSVTQRETYALPKISEGMPFGLSDSTVKLAVTELKRLNGVIIDDGIFETL